MHNAEKEMLNSPKHKNLQPWLDKNDFKVWDWRRKAIGTDKERDQPETEGVLKGSKQLMRDLKHGDHNKNPFTSDQTVWLHFQANNVSAF